MGKGVGRRDKDCVEGAAQRRQPFRFSRLTDRVEWISFDVDVKDREKEQQGWDIVPRRQHGGELKTRHLCLEETEEVKQGRGS